MGFSKPNIIRRTMSNNKPLIKVCGMRDPDNIRTVVQLPICLLHTSDAADE